jgi:hypothetical protein
MHPLLPNRPDHSQISPTASLLAEKITDAVETAKEAILVQKYQTERQYNHGNSVVDNKPYRAGDMVWIKTSHFMPENRRQQILRKLLPEFVGPYPIKRVLNYHAVEIDFPPAVRIDNRISRKFLKRF